MAALVERGVVAESEIVAILQQILPEQLQQLIPADMKAVAVQRPEVVQQQAQEAAYEEPPLSAEQLLISQSGTTNSWCDVLTTVAPSHITLQGLRYCNMTQSPHKDNICMKLVLLRSLFIYR